MKRWFIPAAARARGQPNDLNREILASNLFNCHKEVINTPPVPSISRCIHIVYRHKNVWEYQWSNFIYNCMSTFLHYVHCKDALLDCSVPGGERCESLTWVDEITSALSHGMQLLNHALHSDWSLGIHEVQVQVFYSIALGPRPLQAYTHSVNSTNTFRYTYTWKQRIGMMAGRIINLTPHKSFNALALVFNGHWNITLLTT